MLNSLPTGGQVLLTNQMAPWSDCRTPGTTSGYDPAAAPRPKQAVREAATIFLRPCDLDL